MKIQVTQDDINAGERENPHSCPVACALRREFPNSIIGVYGSVMNRGRFSYNLPEKVAEFVDRFDNMQHVEPFEFELEICKLQK